VAGPGTEEDEDEEEEEKKREELMKKIEAEGSVQREIKILKKELTKQQQYHRELSLIVEAAGSRA